MDLGYLTEYIRTSTAAFVTKHFFAHLAVRKHLGAPNPKVTLDNTKGATFKSSQEGAKKIHKNGFHLLMEITELEGSSVFNRAIGCMLGALVGGLS